jgi:hypothetical protein
MIFKSKGGFKKYLALFFNDNLKKEDDEHSIGVVQPLCH